MGRASSRHHEGLSDGFEAVAKARYDIMADVTMTEARMLASFQVSLIKRPLPTLCGPIIPEERLHPPRA